LVIGLSLLVSGPKTLLVSEKLVLGPQVRATQDVDYSYSVKYIYTVLKFEETTHFVARSSQLGVAVDES
jgi:hypothetical protein